MTSVAILGAGAGGSAAAAELISDGHDVALWSRSTATIDPIRSQGGLLFEGALGSGKLLPERLTDDLSEALVGADVIVVCLPAIAHPALAGALAEREVHLPIVLNPGGTCGAMLFREAFAARGGPVPPIAELSTLTYIARKLEPARVSVYSAPQNVHVACLPGGTSALDAAKHLFKGLRTDPHVLCTSLRNVNLVLHPPIALLAAAWVEATGGEFLAYAEGVTPGTFRLMQVLDSERIALGAAIGIDLPGLIEEMVALGSADRHSYERGLLREAITRGEANRSIKAPESLGHRYYQEDFACAVAPFCELARIFKRTARVAEAMLTVISSVLGFEVSSSGFTPARLGIQGLGPAAVLDLIGARS